MLYTMRTQTKGLTLIELVIAIVIAAVILTPTSLVVYESLRNAFLPEYVTVASSLLEAEVERVTNLRFDEVVNEGPVSFPGNFSGYTYTVSYFYVAGNNLNTPWAIPTDYKRITVTVSRQGFAPLEAVTLAARN